MRAVHTGRPDPGIVGSGEWVVAEFTAAIARGWCRIPLTSEPVGFLFESV